MKIAIMQPYFFPYIGYWQLIHAVDRFVIYDDVNYIKRGWINRNRLLINGKPNYFTVPLHHSSQHKLICDTTLQPTPIWRNKLIRIVVNTYKRAPYFTEVFPVVERVILYENTNLSDFLVNQIQTIAEFMDIDTELVLTSRFYRNNELSGQNRIIDICKRENATIYINPQRGQTLYENSAFKAAGIDLYFIFTHALPYKQKSADFFPFLSIIDALMMIGPFEIKHHLAAYNLVKKHEKHVQQ
jgi:WbqC-like protein family